MKQLSIFICLLFCLTSKAQVNLVPNYSFEDTISGQCNISMGISAISDWYKTNISGTPDVFSYCFNSVQYPSGTSIPYNCRTYQFPQHGNHYIGIVTYELFSSTDSSLINSEGFGVKIKVPLKKGSCYYSSMYINLGNHVSV